eukprot:TRINITY_DN816_c0_g1_i1.p1 TRINITY_DN816_c0_g1~~TRINITY_DN816_c0_g1_i1.p1  ORF type:complete len:326 (+),score=45.44 TRINITY_DN816_c0_g1_i1:156-1133(+)
MYNYNSVDDHIFDEIYNLLGNCCRRKSADFILGPPLEKYLYNTKTNANAKLWKNHRCFLGNNVTDKDQPSTNAPNYDTHRRLAGKMELADFRTKVPPYINNEHDKKRTIPLKSPMGNFNIEVAKKIKMNRKVVEKTKNFGDSRDVTYYHSFLGNTAVKSEVESKQKSMQKSNAMVRYSVHRGKLTEDMAGQNFSYIDLLESQLNDFYSTFTEDEEDLRTVNALARARVLMRKLHNHIHNPSTEEFGLYSDLIYQQLRDFNAVIPDEDVDTKIVIAAARGRVIQKAKLKNVANPPRQHITKPSFSISYTYKRQDRIQNDLGKKICS